MEINFLDKLKTRLMIYGQLNRLPCIKDAIRIFLDPITSTRDVEFTYILKFLRQSNINPSKILDISSPFILAYVLSAKANVIKTDLNPTEQEMIKEDRNLSFKIEDATKLSFSDNSFDLVYSISVIEHIYQNYTDAVKEMIRVLNPGGYLYLSFPVAPLHVEEWLDHKAYPAQYENGGKSFFSYRFDEKDVAHILSELHGIVVINSSIYWERKTGRYDTVMNKLQSKPLFRKLTSARNGFFNFCSSSSLFENIPNDFSHAKSFGNLSIILKKT
jgi:predicted SAM-dependent methyltransferase